MTQNLLGGENLQNPLTGRVIETFKTPYTTQHAIGGRSEGRGLKYFGCMGMNTCLPHGEEGLYEPLEEYQQDD